MKWLSALFGRTDPPDVRKAMEHHRYVHPTCECGCGRMPVDIHHVIPVSIAPSKAADPGNLMSLHHECHIAYGHASDKSCRKYVANLRDVLASRKVVEI